MNIYEGQEKYIFISYAHADSNKVMPILEALDREGFRIWYDSGIEVGSEWPAYIADHIRSCYRMIFFVTESSVNSKNCRREVNLADSLNKEILVAYLEDATLRHGLELQLSTNQAVYRSKYATDGQFVESMARAKILELCKDEAVPEKKAEPIEDKKEEKPEKEAEKPEEKTKNDFNPAVSRKELEMFVCAAFTKYTFYSTYVVGGLKDGKANNAIACYANGVDKSQILVQFDNTVFGSAKEGFVLTAEALYWNAGFSDRGVVKLSDIDCFTAEANDKDTLIVKLKNGYNINQIKIYGLTLAQDIASYLGEILDYINGQSMIMYEGKEKYIFACYAHADGARVVPVLEALYKDGFRIWYDSGLDVGTEWPTHVGEQLKNCHALIYFVTEHSLSSSNCRNEINLACNKYKEVVVAYLDDVELKYGVEQLILTCQVVRRSSFGTDEQFAEALSKVETLRECKK